VFGSDHRPVLADIALQIEEEGFMETASLIDFRQAKKQKCSYFKFKTLKLKNLSISTLEQHLRKKLSFPSHVSCSFYADFLDTQPQSSEVSVSTVTHLYHDLNWTAKELPVCCSPINTADLVRNRRLIIVFWLTNELCI